MEIKKNPIPKQLQKALQERETAGTLRHLSDESYLIDFYSNDYIGLAKNAAVRTKAHSLLGEYPLQNGSTGSRLLSGNYLLIRKAEGYLAAFQGMMPMWVSSRPFHKKVMWCYMISIYMPPFVMVCN